MTILLVTVDNAIQHTLHSGLQFGNDASLQTCATLQEAGEILRRDRDVRTLAIDFNTPELGGLKAVEKLIQQRPDIQVMLMDQAPTMAIGSQALRAGVTAYVPSQIAPETLADALKVTSCNCDVMLLPRNVAVTKNKSGTLSRRELQILSLLCDGQQNKESAHAFGIQEVTVKMHMRSVIRKLGARNRTHAAMIARDQGLV
ncbi:LuxR C-terminal-related transcriptional regulator [Aliiroseovarius sp. 2305UL8-7]|uniref:LuxR C-terminal-related transcriptional regulator n=1 Tax=Aliiroseovarius conchicola TaxID=3121637 RepID=UPI0035281925